MALGVPTSVGTLPARAPKRPVGPSGASSFPASTPGTNSQNTNQGYSYSTTPLSSSGQPLTWSFNDPNLANINAQAGALFAESGLQNKYLSDQFGRYATPNYQLAQGDLQGSYDQNMAQLASQQVRNGINAQGNAADLGFAGQQYGNQLTSIAANRGFNAKDRGLLNANAGNLSAQALAQFGIGSDRNKLTLTQQNQSDRSSATARGAIPSLGYKQNVKNAASNWDIAQRDTQLGLDSANNSINNSLQQGLLGLDRADSGLDSQRSSADLGYQKAQSDAALSKQLTDQIAQEYGVTSAQLTSAFQRGMQKLGLDYHKAQDSLAEAQRTGNSQAVSAYMQLMQQALQYAS